MTERTKENTLPPGYTIVEKEQDHSPQTEYVVKHDRERFSVVVTSDKARAITNAWDRYLDQPPTVITVGKLKFCARCGLDHDDLTFRAFRQSPNQSSYTHWVECPTTGEPILMEVTES